MMEISGLASGSSGNCFYVGDNKKGVLIDAGISCKQIEERLGKIKRSPEMIKGVFVTHEHSDHIKGIDVFARKYNVPVFATKKTIKGREICSNPELINIIKNKSTVRVGNMEIESFSKSHKASNPVSFNIYNSKKISIITDLGKLCKNVKKSISKSDFLCLESNHSLNMLEQGNYPYFLKNWIKSDIGHFSNSQAALSVLEFGNSNLKNVMLCHLSENNNLPELALGSFKVLKERKDLHPDVSVSGRHLPTKLFKV